MAAALVVAHIAAAMPVWLLQLAFPWKLLWLAAVALSAGRELWLCLGDQRVIRVRRISDGQWELTTGRGIRTLMHLRGWYANPWLCVLDFRGQNGRPHGVVIARHSVGSEVHRKVRLLLRLECGTSGL
jgi:hypothetical protein